MSWVLTGTILDRHGWNPKDRFRVAVTYWPTSDGDIIRSGDTMWASFDNEAGLVDERGTGPATFPTTNGVWEMRSEPEGLFNHFYFPAPAEGAIVDFATLYDSYAAVPLELQDAAYDRLREAAIQGAIDGVTPESIGAYPATGPTYTGHIDDLREPSAYRISSSSMNAGNGYPWTPDVTGYVIVHRYSSAYVTQEVISETGVTWRRNSVAGSTAWRDWTPIAVDTDWRTHPLDNGWTGDLRYRWRNGAVSVSVTGLDGTNATNSNIVGNFGGHAGFHAGAGTPAHGLGHLTSNVIAPEGSVVGSIGLVGGGSNNIMRASSPSAGWQGGAASMTYVASRMALPATLPGNPV